MQHSYPVLFEGMVNSSCHKMPNMAELHRKAEPWPLSKTMISCNLLHHHNVHSSSGQIVWMAYSDYSGMFILQCKVSPKRVVSIRFLPCVAL